MDSQTSRKRKRAAVACELCHRRKVRCNVALQGIPCANCAQDGVHCKVYGQPSTARPGQPLRPRDASQEAIPAYPPTPSSGSAYIAPEVKPGAAQLPAMTRIPTYSAISPAHASAVARTPQDPAIDEQSPDVLGNARRERSPNPDPSRNLVPYYSGEAEGFEFLFDITSPNRPVKGGPYVIARNVHRREWKKPDPADGPRALPSPAIRDQLIRCFFHYVFPFLPCVNAREFLTTYNDDPTRLSRLLLWSVFFASSSYLSMEDVESAGFKTRKSMKEYCYHTAKALYDDHAELDKTTTISSALLLAFWYVDLEDTDGSWHWIGIASNLCQTIGLHREPSFARMQPKCPFTPAQQALWRRLFWCCYYRDAWLALGCGRPMRLHLDDCDLKLPSLQDITADFVDIPLTLKEMFIPMDIDNIVSQWIVLLQVSAKLEDIIKTHYRPRRAPLSLAQLDKDDGEIWQLFETVPRETEYWSASSTLHVCHLKTYFNAVTITLYRSYMTHQPEHLTSAEKESLKVVAHSRCKGAAASTTNAINRLIGLDLIHKSSTMVVTGMLIAMQIHLFEYAHSTELARQHAYHNLNLHMMVLSHLKKTYWSADMIHNLFTECLKALDSGTGKIDRQAAVVGVESTPSGARTPAVERVAPEREDQSYDVTDGLDNGSLCAGAMDDLFWTYNPFYNMQYIFDQSAPVEWSNGHSLHLDVA